MNIYENMLDKFKTPKVTTINKGTSRSPSAIDHETTNSGFSLVPIGSDKDTRL